MYKNQSHSIVKRINSLESQNRVMRLFLIGVIVILVGCSQIDSVRYSNPVTAVSEQDVLELKKLIFKDDNSNVRIKIDATNDSDIQQSFYDKQGIERARISIDEQGSARFRLFDTAGSVRFSAVTFSDTHEEAADLAAVAVLGYGNEDANMKNGGIYLSTDNNRIARSSVYDSAGTVRESFNTYDDTASFQLYDRFGKKRHEFNTFNNDSNIANRIIFDSDENIRQYDYTTLDGAGQKFFDNKKTKRGEFYTAENGNATYLIYDNLGKTRHAFNTFNNDSNLANQLLFDNKGNVRQINYTTSTSSGESNLDSNGENKTSTIISEDNSLSYYVEKNATQKTIDFIDGVFRTGDILRVLSGNQ